ncbi:MAG TPA: toll/interleukin-1 receptor domain-containing protein, partial [Longimicrobium sp.]|nr:toll/interleukin-1 receptor domain-containing protein [Longimicrobium sp.]
MKVFISHRSTDGAWAKRLATDLRAAGVHAWLDTWDMPPGKPITDAMQDGIEESQAMVLVLTPQSVESIKAGTGGVAFEVHIGEGRRIKDGNFRIIGLLREACNPPEKLQNRLGRWLDFTQDEQYTEKLGELIGWLTGRPLGPPVANPDALHVENFPSFPADVVYTGIAGARQSIIVLSTWVYGMRTLTDSILEAVVDKDC